MYNFRLPLFHSLTTLFLIATTAEYICVYGISTAEPGGLVPNELVISCYKGLVLFTLASSKDKVYWSIIKKADEKYRSPNIPRFTKSDAEDLCKSVQERKVAEGVDFSYVWAHRVFYEMTAVEENVFDHWHFGRIVCLGDSVHKVSQQHHVSYSPHQDC